MSTWSRVRWLAVLMLLLAWSWSQLGDLPDRIVEKLGLDMPASVTLQDGDTFDYIVVGGGTAGSAAAARLSLAGASVLLVEAGGDPNLLTRIPGVGNSLIGTSLDWQYETIPNNISCLSSQRQQCRFSSGKVLGGSSSINSMIYLRGHPSDYDELGIPGWTWKDMEPYFLRYEGLQCLDKLPETSTPYHNTNGPMKVDFFTKSANPWHARIMKGFEQLNFPVNYDLNAESQIGVSQVMGFVYKGERMSTALGYLAREDVQKTLKVAKHTHCIGVIIDEHNAARGVTVVQTPNGRTLRIHARHEVVLSAGTVATAQILMLSGIGPADHLESLKIPVRADLPVGDNLSDHMVPMLFIQVDRRVLWNVPKIFILGEKGVEGMRWLTRRDGPLASRGIGDITVLANTRCYDPELRRLVHNSSACELSTFELCLGYIDRNLIPGMEAIVYQGTGLNEDIARQLADVNVNQALIVTIPSVLQPYSRGNIRLSSANPLDSPAIFPNFLSDERDLEEMLRAITIFEHLVETPEFKEQDASLLHLKLPGCGEYEEDRERYWRCYCRHMTYSVYHAVGTAPLGAVLDPSLRVHGVRGLRVADLSALPKLPRGNTAAIAIAIGERVADFILQDDTRKYAQPTDQPSQPTN